MHKFDGAIKYWWYDTKSIPLKICVITNTDIIQYTEDLTVMEDLTKNYFENQQIGRAHV